MATSENAYGSLWDKLSDTGREILHALAGSEFHWPSLGIRQCLGNYDEISFLLDARESGILPFHGSLLAYVRDRHDHSEKFQALLPRIVTWLEKCCSPLLAVGLALAEQSQTWRLRAYYEGRLS